MQEAHPGSQVNPVKVVAVSLIVLLGLAAASWPLIKTYRKTVRAKELLGEFVQVSDDFTRPKFYIQRSFYKKDPADKPKTFIYRLGAYSDGRVNLPEIPATPQKENSEVFSLGYDVIMNLEDRLFRLEREKTTKEYVATLRELHEWADELGGPETMKLLCRIKRSGYSTHAIIEGDFMLAGEELEAFLKTLELTRIFNEAAEK
jgi:hypothetical protein